MISVWIILGWPIFCFLSMDFHFIFSATYRCPNYWSSCWRGCWLFKSFSGRRLLSTVRASSCSRRIRQSETIFCGIIASIHVMQALPKGRPRDKYLADDERLCKNGCKIFHYPIHLLRRLVLEAPRNYFWIMLKEHHNSTPPKPFQVLTVSSSKKS